MACHGIYRIRAAGVSNGLAITLPPNFENNSFFPAEPGASLGSMVFAFHCSATLNEASEAALTARYGKRANQTPPARSDTRLGNPSKKWETFTQFILHCILNGHDHRDSPEQQGNPMSAQENPGDDWAKSLFLKRCRGRRMLPDDLLPPYQTEEGLVLIDRRSHQDRRKSLATDISNTPGHA